MQHAASTYCSSLIPCFTFWERLSKITDGTDNLPFVVLCEFMQTLLCLPHSNVDVERTFSDVSSIKMKKRNRLQLKTLQAILQVKLTRNKGGRWMYKI